MPTEDRLEEWVLDNDSLWVLCNQRGSHVIISFLNVTSLAFLEQFFRKNQINRLSNQWENELDSALHQCSRNSFTGSATSAYKLPLAATIYHQWMEGNARVFSHIAKDPSAFLKLKALKLDIRERISS